MFEFTTTNPRSGFVTFWQFAVLGNRDGFSVVVGASRTEETGWSHLPGVEMENSRVSRFVESFKDNARRAGFEVS